MTAFDIVKKLADEQKISIVELEEKVGFGRNSIYSWKKNNPSSEKLERVADFFSVSTDYLLGRTERKYWELNEKDEKYIQDKLQAFIDDLSNTEVLSFNKDSAPLSEEDKQLLIISMENSLRLGKQMAKKKFTPKKYRGSDTE